MQNPKTLKDFFENISTDLLHHAYLIERPSSTDLEFLYEYFTKLLNGERAHSHPDFLHIKNSQFDIENSGYVIDFNSNRAMRGGKKIICIQADTAGHQAQNSLLKTLEEPNPETHIFIITNSASNWLPTILSRVQVVKDYSDSSSTEEASKLIKEFLAGDIGVRMQIVKDLIEENKVENKVEDGSRGPSPSLINFLDGLERAVNDYIVSSVGAGGANAVNGANAGSIQHSIRPALKAMNTAREYFNDNGASKKMLLEYIAIYIPKIIMR